MKRGGPHSGGCIRCAVVPPANIHEPSGFEGWIDNGHGLAGDGPVDLLIGIGRYDILDDGDLAEVRQ
jgi:hypothetical protein